MEYVRFPPKAVIVCFGEEKGFDYKNNHGCGKLANFRLNNTSKINYKTLIVLSYTLSRLELRKVQLVRRHFR